MMIDGDGTIRWAPKVPQWQLRRLYETDAQGMIDDDLIDKVGWALWERCDSILTVTAAHYGHVRCASCATIIARQNCGSTDEHITCPACGWSIAWVTYHRTYRGKQLFGANAVNIFKQYHDALPRAQTARAKMLLIDQLIHAFHVGLQDIGRPVAANLIDGSLTDVIHFLDTLTHGERSATGVGDSRDTWRRTLAAAAWFAPASRNDGDP
jgi:predicted RNA-binding Zn-ribbon protein involved in translation (DUF1610 family)